MESKLYKVTEYKKIVSDLLNGKVVGFPTETVYGLAIVYNNKEAFDKLYEIIKIFGKTGTKIPHIFEMIIRLEAHCGVYLPRKTSYNSLHKTRNLYCV